MKTAVLTEPGVIEVREVGVPELRPGEVLVKLKNCGICTLEQRLYSVFLAGERPIPIDANTLHKNEIVISRTEGRTVRDFRRSIRLLSLELYPNTRRKT